ncbi:MAG: methylated-DNA--[protein]-cysteine S-methyltransferase [Bacillota bacterium]
MKNSKSRPATGGQVPAARGDDLRWTAFDAGGGWQAAVRSGRGLRYLTLPRKGRREAVDEVRRLYPTATEDPGAFGDLVADLRRYFAGERVDLSRQATDLEVTVFQRRVLEACADIPYGSTNTYAELAATVGRPGAARAVGQVMAANPVPLVLPCHRVLATGGGLGGFGGGLPMKRWLLDMEAGKVRSEGAGSGRQGR